MTISEEMSSTNSHLFVIPSLKLRQEGMEYILLPSLLHIESKAKN